MALETFVQLWRQRERLRDADAVDGWLARTARNLARKQVRDQARGRKACRVLGERAEASMESPDRAAMQAEMARRVREAIAEQPEADQQVMLASESAESDADAAAELEMPLATYRTRLHRARQRLRELLKKHGVVPAVGALAGLAGLPRRAVAAFGWARVVVVAAVCFAGLVGVTVWAAGWMRKPEEPGPTIEAVVPAKPVDQAAIDRARPERTFSPLIDHVRASLGKVTFGNQGGITLRELRHDLIRPSALFDWVHREVENGKVTFELRTGLEVGYDAVFDTAFIDFYPSGLDGRKWRVNPDHQVIPYTNAAKGIKWSFNLPGSKRGRELLEQVRLEYAARKNVLDELAPWIRPGLEKVFGRLICGNEGRVEFVAIRYCLNSPGLSFNLRHRQVTAGKVEYDTTHPVSVVYWCDNDTATADWNYPGSNHTPCRLTPDLETRISPNLPPGPGNPRLPTERLNGLAEAIAPFAAAIRATPVRK